MNAAQLNIFNYLQSILIPIIDKVAIELQAGMKEKEIEIVLKQKLKKTGISNFWYPVMIATGENTSKFFSRRIHLPGNTEIKENDIIIIDATPLDKTESVWGNWCQTYSIGNDSFYTELCRDALDLTIRLEEYAVQEAKTVGDVYSYFNETIRTLNLELIGNNIGHSIFSVPKGQTVERTPINDRLFIDEKHKNHTLNGVLSIEPQLKRFNPKDGKYYAAKHQRIIIYE